MSREKQHRESSSSSTNRQPFFGSSGSFFATNNSQPSTGFFQQTGGTTLVQRDLEGSCQANCHGTQEQSPFTSPLVPPAMQENDEGLLEFIQHNEAQLVGQQLNQMHYGDEHTISITYNIGGTQDSFQTFTGFFPSNYEALQINSLNALQNVLMEGSNYFIHRLSGLVGVSRQYQSFFQQWITRWMEFQNTIDHANESNFATLLQQFRANNTQMASAIWRNFGQYITLSPSTRTARSAQAQHLSAAQLVELRRLATELDYSQFHRFYNQFKDVIENTPGLSFMLSSVQNTDTLVEARYREQRPRIPGDLFNRLKLLSKLISQQGNIDRLMTYVNLRENIEGQENEVYFNEFVRRWHNLGWVTMVNSYNTLSDRNLRMTESGFHALNQQTQAALGLRIGRAFAIDARVRMEVLSVNIRETLQFFLTESWSFFETIFLARIPGWALIKLGVTSAASGISAIADAFSEESTPNN